MLLSQPGCKHLEVSTDPNDEHERLSRLDCICQGDSRV